jgi:hypothetical protein
MPASSAILLELVLMLAAGDGLAASEKLCAFLALAV